MLLEFGRLNLPSIVKHTNLNVNIVKQTLVVLIQLHLVTHFTSGVGPRSEVYYESAWENIYSLIHSGRIIAVAEERFGPEGAWVVSNMLELGHVRVKDFINGCGLPTKPTTGKGAKAATNGTSEITTSSPEGRPATLAQLKTIMTELLKNRFLTKVEDHHMHPKTDVVNALRLSISTQVKQNHGTISDIKLKKLVDDKMAEKMHEMEVGDTSEHAGLKRKMADVGVKQTKRPNKRVKLANDFEDVNGKEEVWEIDVIITSIHTFMHQAHGSIGRYRCPRQPRKIFDYFPQQGAGELGREAFRKGHSGDICRSIACLRKQDASTA